MSSSQNIDTNPSKSLLVAMIMVYFLKAYGLIETDTLLQDFGLPLQVAAAIRSTGVPPLGS